MQKGSRIVTYAARCIENELLMMLRSERNSAREVSLYDPIGTDKEGNEINLLDIIETDESDIVDQIALRNNIQPALQKPWTQSLDARERKIICRRYGLKGYPPVTQKKSPGKLGISRSYVSRIEKKALEKLKIVMEPWQ